MQPQRLAENHGVLAYLGQGLPIEGVPVERPAEDVDIRRLGTHPDVVEWLWQTLNPALPGDARFLIAHGAALAHPESGLILAAAIGTQYAIRITAGLEVQAAEFGYESSHTFQSVGRTLDLATEFGPGWFFGQFDRREGEWLAEAYRAANL